MSTNSSDPPSDIDQQPQPSDGIAGPHNDTPQQVPKEAQDDTPPQPTASRSSSGVSNHHPDYAKEASSPPSKPPQSSPPPPPPSTASAQFSQCGRDLQEIDKELQQWQDRRKAALLKFAALHWRLRAALRLPSSSALSGVSTVVAAAITSLSSSLIHLESEATQLASLYVHLQQRIAGITEADSEGRGSSSRKAELLVRVKTKQRWLERQKEDMIRLKGRVANMQDELTKKTVQAARAERGAATDASQGDRGSSSSSGQSDSHPQHKTTVEIEDITAEEEEKERSHIEQQKTALYTREDISASLHVATEHKTRGNASFHNNNFSSAFDDYKQALAAIHHLSVQSVLQQGYHELANELKQLLVSIHSNMAACRLITKQWDDVVLHTNLVLQLDPENVKGLIRRGKAYAAKNEVALALIDLLRAREMLKDDEKGRKEIEPFIREIQRRAYEQVQQESREKEKEKEQERERQKAKEREKESEKQKRFAEAFQQAMRQQAKEEEEEKRMQREEEEKEEKAREIKVRFKDMRGKTDKSETPKQMREEVKAKDSPRLSATQSSTASSPSTTPTVSGGKSPRAAGVVPPSPSPIAAKGRSSSTGATVKDQSEKDVVNTLLQQLFGVPPSQRQQVATSRGSPRGVASSDLEEQQKQHQQLATVLERQVSEAKQREQESARQRMAVLESELRRERDRQGKLRAQLQQQQQQRLQQHQQRPPQPAAAASASAPPQQPKPQPIFPAVASGSRPVSGTAGSYVELPDEHHDFSIDTSQAGTSRQPGQRPQAAQHGPDNADDLIDSIFSHLLGIPVTAQRMSPPASSYGLPPRSTSPATVQVPSYRPHGQYLRSRSASPSPPRDDHMASIQHQWGSRDEEPRYARSQRYHDVVPSSSRGQRYHDVDVPSRGRMELEDEDGSYESRRHGYGGDRERYARAGRPGGRNGYSHAIPVSSYPPAPASPPASIPIDIFDRPSTFHLQAHLPGVRPSDVSISFTSHSTLLISARQQRDWDEWEGGGGASGWRKLEREVSLPTDVDTASVEARFEDGMLRVRMRKMVGDSRGEGRRRRGDKEWEQEEEWRTMREQQMQKERERMLERPQPHSRDHHADTPTVYYTPDNYGWN